MYRPRTGMSSSGFLFGILLGVVLLGVGVHYYLKGQAARRWPTASGTIDSSSIETHRGRRSSIRYRCVVRYHFTVEGRAYTGDTIDPNGSGSSHATASEQLARYPAGRTCNVRYNPENPSDCCLEAESSYMACAGIGFGVLFLLGALAPRRSY